MSLTQLNAHAVPIRIQHSSPLHQPDLLICQFVQLIHQGIDLGIGGIDLALEQGFLGRGFGIGKLLVQTEHAFDQDNNLISLKYLSSVR